MSHIKAMLVDDEALVVGSSNFDYLSFHTHQEVLAIVRSPEVIAQYKRDVLDPDLAHSVGADGGVLRLPRRRVGNGRSAERAAWRCR